MRLLKRCLSRLAHAPRGVTKVAQCSVLATWILLATCIPVVHNLPVKRGASLWDPQITSAFQVKRSAPSSFDWCSTKASRKPDQEKSRQTLMESLEQEGYDWPLLHSGLTKLKDLANETKGFGNIVLDKLDAIINNGITKELAAMYLEEAKNTPLAKQLITENSLDIPINAPAMARRIEDVLQKHAKTLSGMLIRLKLLSEKENQEHLKILLSGFMGDTRLVLCLMQEVFLHVAPQYSLPGPTEESDMNYYELNTLGEEDSPTAYMRRFAAYGVVTRHQHNLNMMGEDLKLLKQQIMEHTSQ